MNLCTASTNNGGRKKYPILCELLNTISRGEHSTKTTTTTTTYKVTFRAKFAVPIGTLLQVLHAQITGTRENFFCRVFVHIYTTQASFISLLQPLVDLALGF